jgi:signal peptidase I
MINGQPLDEPYEKLKCDWNTVSMTLGPNDYFVVGDNRTMSQFDHFFGKVERTRIVGKVLR